MQRNSIAKSNKQVHVNDDNLLLELRTSERNVRAEKDI